MRTILLKNYISSTLILKGLHQHNVCNIKKNVNRRNYSTIKKITDDCFTIKRKGAQKRFFPVTHVIFDLDGTILNSDNLYADSHMKYLAKFNKNFTWDLREKVLGSSEKDQARISTPSKVTIINELNLKMSPETYMHGVWQYQRETLYDAKIKKGYIGLKPLICHLSDNGIPIAIATSSSDITFTMKTAKYDKLFKKFCHVVVANDSSVKRSKPYPYIYETCMKRFKKRPTNPQSVLVLEDSPNGVKAAKSAGMQVVMIPDPQLSSKAQTGADLVLRNITELNMVDFSLPSFDYTQAVD